MIAAKHIGHIRTLLDFNLCNNLIIHFIPKIVTRELYIIHLSLFKAQINLGCFNYSDM